MNNYDYIFKIITSEPKIVLDSRHQPFLKPGSIPDTVRELIFNNYFNNELEPGVIPMGTQIVEFGRSYNKQLKPGVFPASVECIKFGPRFKSSLAGILPENLKSLYIADYEYPHSLVDVVPTSVTEFHFAVSEKTLIIPEGVTHLYILGSKGEYTFDIPANVKRIYVSPRCINFSNNIIDVIQKKHHEFTVFWDLNEYIKITKYFNTVHILEEKIQDNYVLTEFTTTYPDLKRYNTQVLYSKNDKDHESHKKILDDKQKEINDIFADHN